MIAPEKMNGSAVIQSRDARSGFTLIELLTVIVIIAILSAISFGIMNGVQDAQNRAKAQAELAVLSQVIEQYKSAYGDYPWSAPGDPTNSSPADAMDTAISNSELLLNALMGWGRFASVSGSMQFDSALEGKSLLDVSKFTVRQKGSDETYVDYPMTSLTSAPSDYYLADPWGNPYVYIYTKTASGGTWNTFGYHLYSKGSDSIDSGDGINFSTGVVSDAETYRYSDENADNIYAGE